MSKRRPNILLIITDQHRFDWVGMNSDIPVRTPNLKDLTNRGVWFTNAISPSPVCGPSRACLASGKSYENSGVLNNDMNYPVEQTTVYGLLRDDAGYEVMGCGKFDLHKADFSWGTDGDYLLKQWGFTDGLDTAGKWATVNSWDEHHGPNDPYMSYLEQNGVAERHLEDFRRRREDFPSGTYPTPLPDHAYADNFVGRAGLNLLNRASTSEPWFLQVNFPGPHDPWDVTETMHGWYRDPEVLFPEPPKKGDEISSEVHQEVCRNYAAMIENIDDWLGRFCNWLDANSMLSETIILFCSDHGEMLGSQGRWRKKVPYQPSVGVPLVMAGPDISPREATDTPVSILDLHETVLDWAGVTTRNDSESKSLEPYLRNETDNHRDMVYSAYGYWRLVYDGRYKLILGYDPESPMISTDDLDFSDSNRIVEVLKETDPLLFDRQKDPKEIENIAPSNPDIRRSLENDIWKMFAKRTGVSR